MPALITFGRVLFAVLFIYTGATKLFGIQQTADFIAAKVAIPVAARALHRAARNHDRHDDAANAGDGVGGFEIIAGLMIAVNFGARFFAILLIFFVVARPSTSTISGTSRRRKMPRR